MGPNLLVAVAGLCLASVLWGCASSPLTGTLVRSSASGLDSRRVLVLAVLGNSVSRQAVEDEVVRHLGLAGVTAIAGYRVAPDIGDLPDERLVETLAASQAETVLVCRWHLVRQSSRGQGGFVGAREVRQMAYGEASLRDARTLDTVWSAPTRTELLGGFRDSARGVAQGLLVALKDGGALPVGNVAELGTGSVAEPRI